MLNTITISGRLTRDPELRYTSNNTPVCTFSVAVDRDIPAPGEEKTTDFFNCVAWKQGAEFVSKYIRKGNLVVVTGSLQTRSFEGKDGEHVKLYEIVASRTYFAEGKKKDETAQTTATQWTDIDPDDGDLPF